MSYRKLIRDFQRISSNFEPVIHAMRLYRDYIYYKMEQQLAEDTIDIGNYSNNTVPATMHDVLAKICQILSLAPLSEETLNTVVKSMFYGLWNFDKMINQHNLSTLISEMLHKLPRKNAFQFLESLMNYLTEKWNYIDHQRINKFMQLVRYLVKQALKLSQKKTE